MSYNIKITEFANGQVEVVTYEQGVKTLVDGEYSFRADLRDINSEVSALKFATFVVNAKTGVGKFYPRFDDREVVYNPFTECVQRLESIDSIKMKEKQCEDNLLRSLRRTRSALYTYARQCVWDYFITLTFSPVLISNRYDYSLCMKKARKWINNCRERKASSLLYLFVPEQHTDGAWHLHGLLANTLGLTFVDSGKKHKGQIVYNFADWTLGFSTATKVTDTYKVSAYITKYITKDLCAVTSGKQRYFVSKTIPKPKTYTALVDSDKVDNFIQEVADSFGANLEYQKDVNGYLNVNYKYYKKCQKGEKEENGEQ